MPCQGVCDLFGRDRGKVVVIFACCGDYLKPVMDDEGEGEHSRTRQKGNKLLHVYRVVIWIKRSNIFHKYLGLLLNSKSLCGRTYLLSPRFLPT